MLMRPLTLTIIPFKYPSLMYVAHIVCPTETLWY